MGNSFQPSAISYQLLALHWYWFHTLRVGAKLLNEPEILYYIKLGCHYGSLRDPELKFISLRIHSRLKSSLGILHSDSKTPKLIAEA